MINEPDDYDMLTSDAAETLGGMLLWAMGLIGAGAAVVWVVF